MTTTDPAQIGARIKATRISVGLTQAQLAGKEASVAFLSRIETGQRRPSVDLLHTLAERLGVTVDFLLLGDGWEDARRLELQLDHAELSLVGGEAQSALRLAREALASPSIASVSGGATRAAYLEAAALDSLGDPDAASAFQRLLDARPDSITRVKAATALSRIWRERRDLRRAIACAQAALDELDAEVMGSDEGIRLAVTLAAALFMDGRTGEAAELCDRAIAEAERLSSPVARASAYWNASVIRSNSGDIDEAISLARRALLLLENTERVRDVGRLRTQLGAILLRSDPPRLQDAKEQLRIADTELDWSEANPTDRARNQIVNAQAFYMDGQFELARERAEAVVESTSDEMPLVCVDGLVLLGQIAWSTGDLDGARAHYRDAIVTLTGLGADRDAGQVWFELGTLAGGVGLVEEAADCFRRAAVSTGLSARLPVVTQPPTPRTTPQHAPAGRF